MDVIDSTIAAFTSQDIYEASGLSAYQVAQLRKKGLIKPTKQGNTKFLYRFSDVVVARDIGRLVSEGSTFAKLVAAYCKVMTASGDQFRHASAIKLIRNDGSIGGDVLMMSGKDLIVPESGERAFDFDEIRQPLRSRRVHSLESLRRANRVAAASESAEDWYEYALDCEDDENIGEAKRAYEVCVSHDETNADAWVNLGRLHFLTGLQLDSRYCYERALRIDKNHQIGNYNLGILFEMFEASEHAIKHLEKAASIPESFQCLARIHDRLGHTKQAKSYQKMFFERNSKDS